MSQPCLLSLRVVAFLAFFLLPISPHAQAKEKEEPITRPPSPQPVVASAYVGERTAIDLSLRGRIEDPVTIIIRKNPQFGLISEPVRVNRKTWRVWYSVPSGSGENLDSFSYAAQSVDSPVSVAAQVQVSILSRPAQLVFSDSLDFGSVPVGDTLVKEIDIQNSGGKTAVISTVLRPPWKLVDAIPIQIKGGEPKKISVVFSPVSSGAFAEKLLLERHSKRGITLKGDSENPIQWPSERLLFASDQRKVARSVVFKNLTDQDREIVFEWPEFLEAPSHVTLDPQSSIEILIQLKAAPAFSWEGEVPFSSANFKGFLAIAVEPAPAHITIQPDSVLDLGELSIGFSKKLTLKLGNFGGRPIRLSIGLPSEVKVSPPPAGVLLEPGQDATFEAVLTPRKVGTFNLSLPVHHGSNEERLGEFRVAFSVRDAVIPSTPAPPPTPTQTPSPPPLPGPAIPLRPVKKGYHSVVLEWDLSDGIKQLISDRIKRAEDFFFLERRDIDANANVVWRKLERFVDLQIQDRTVTAHLRKIPAGTFWYVRLRSHDELGVLNPEPNEAYRIETKPYPVVPFWIWASSALALPLTIVFLLKKRFRFGSNADDLDARIRKLEK